MSSTHHRICCCTTEQSEPKAICGCRCGNQDTDCCYQFNNMPSTTAPTVKIVSGNLVSKVLSSTDGSCAGSTVFLSGFPEINITNLVLPHSVGVLLPANPPFTMTGGRCGLFEGRNSGSEITATALGGQPIASEAGDWFVQAWCSTVIEPDDDPYLGNFEWKFLMAYTVDLGPEGRPGNGEFIAVEKGIGYPFPRLGGRAFTVTSNPHDTGSFSCEDADITYVVCAPGEKHPTDPSRDGNDRVTNVTLTIEVQDNSCCYDSGLDQCVTGTPLTSGACPP